MKNKSLCILFGFFLVTFSLKAQYTLTVKVYGIDNTNGQVEVALYNDAELFPEVGKTLQMVRIKPEAKEVVYEFKNLKAGEYAIATFHDENDDKVCNTNLIGIPTEAFAFSNDFRPFLSAPSFEDCSFNLSQNMEVTIEMVY